MLSLAGPIVVSLFSTAAHLLLQLLSYPCDQVVNTFEELIRLLQISTVQASEWHLVRDGGQALVFYDAFFILVLTHIDLVHMADTSTYKQK